MKIKARFLFLSYLVLTLVPIFSQNEIGANDVLSFEEIDALISETNYDLALVALHNYISVYPEQFDKAQKRIRHIMDIRNKYSEKASYLVDVIENEPDNDEKILSIINELESLEKNPSEKQLAFIRDIRISVEFNVYRKQFLAILNEGVELAKNSEYANSTEKIKSGFFMYQDKFFQETEQENIVLDVRNTLAQIDIDIASYKNIQTNLQRRINDFINAVKAENINLSNSTFSEVKAAYSELAKIRNSFYEAGWQLEKTFETISAGNENVTDASFLPFISRYVLGIDTIDNSGLCGTIDYEWDILVKRMEDEIESVLLKNTNNFISEVTPNIFENNNKFPNRKNLSNAISFSEIGSSVNNLYSLQKDRNGLEAKTKFPNFSISTEYISFISQKALNMIDTSEVLIAKTKSFAENSTPNLDSLGSEDGNKFVATMSGYADEIEKMEIENAKDILDSSSEVISYNNATNTQSDNLIALNNFTSAYKKFNDDAVRFKLGASSNLWQQIASWSALCGENYVVLREKDYDNLITLVNGEKDNTGNTFKYPSKVSSSASDLKNNISKNKTSLEGAQDMLVDGKYASSYNASLKSISQSIKALDKILPQIAPIELSASEQMRYALLAKNEAELRYNQSKDALDKNDFDTARKRLQESRTKFNESLSYEENEELRKSSDAKLLALDAQIQSKHNAIIVRQVRDLKTKARSEYYNGNFDVAENILVQAKTLWAITNVTEDEEISTLLALVSTALTMKVGRVILPSAPLYPEMSQILSVAQQYFKEGQSLLKSGDTQKAKNILSTALQKLQELLLVYPINQEASVLSLKIQQLLDPAGFTALFAKRVESARDNYKVRGQEQIAYADLLDLNQINSSYPGLEKLIYDVEIDLGIRQKPIDRTSITRSATITSQAKNIVDSAGRDEVQLRSALVLVDEAIALDPNNNNAILLKDRIQILIGGQAVIVLSSEDEAKYQSAISAMQNNNIVTANVLVEELLQKEANKRSSKIIDLQKKIKALL